MFFPFRETKKEIMDDYSIIDQRMFTALDELEIINKYLGGIGTTKKGIELLAADHQQKNVIRILDIGSGFSDVFNFDTDTELNVIRLDINAGILKRLKAGDSNAVCICADAGIRCVKEKSFDLIHMSLFLHHLNDSQIKLLFSDIKSIAKTGIIINDLRRNIVAYLAIRVLTYLFSGSEMVKNDGPLSVKKGFVKRDLISLLNEFEFKYVIKRKWAFRWLVCIYLGNN